MFRASAHVIKARPSIYVFAKSTTLSASGSEGSGTGSCQTKETSESQPSKSSTFLKIWSSTSDFRRSWSGSSIKESARCNDCAVAFVPILSSPNRIWCGIPDAVTTCCTKYFGISSTRDGHFGSTVETCCQYGCVYSAAESIPFTSSATFVMSSSVGSWFASPTEMERVGRPCLYKAWAIAQSMFVRRSIERKTERINDVPNSISPTFSKMRCATSSLSSVNSFSESPFGT